MDFRDQTIEDQEIELDGNVFTGCTFRRCRFRLSGYWFRGDERLQARGLHLEGGPATAASYNGVLVTDDEYRTRRCPITGAVAAFGGLMSPWCPPDHETQSATNEHRASAKALPLCAVIRLVSFGSASP